MGESLVQRAAWHQEVTGRDTGSPILVSGLCWIVLFEWKYSNTLTPKSQEMPHNDTILYECRICSVLSRSVNVIGGVNQSDNDSLCHWHARTLRLNVFTFNHIVFLFVSSADWRLFPSDYESQGLLMQSMLSLKRLLACGGQARMPQLNPHHHSLENSEVISQIPFFGAFFLKSFFNFSCAPLESRDLAVKFNKAMAAGTSKCGLCRVSWFSFIPNCSPHMWQMTPKATVEGSPALYDLLAAEEQLALFMGDILRDLAPREWRVTEPSACTVPGTCDLLITVG